MNRRFAIIFLCLTAAAMDSVGAQSTGSQNQKYPDVVAARVRVSGPGDFDFDVTISSPYDSAQRYADAFRVRLADGTVLGERKLLHDHAGEQPFTRDLYGVKVPGGVKIVVVQARDQQYGYGGAAVKLELPGR